jgi:NAD+ diphosphatase
MSLRGLALSRSTVDRATVEREDPSWIEAAWASPTTRVLVISEGRALLGPDGFLSFITTDQAPAGTRFFLGLDPEDPASPTPPAPVPVSSAAPVPHAGQIAYFGISGPLPDIPGTETVTLRQSGALLSGRDAGLLTHAVALANWHDSHTHCPRCGAPTVPAPAGHLATCSVDGTQHFPRTDPAVIMLVTDGADRCLLARNAAWGERRMSVLAGFVEPGESAEMAVVREVFEETAVTVTDVRYLGSQPWPMPRSLMLGYRASAPGEQSIVVEAEEIAEARWFTRSELLAALKASELALPPQSSIARRIIESWYGAELPSGSVPFR